MKFRHLSIVAVLLTSVCFSYGQDKTAVSDQQRVNEILQLAKRSSEEDGNINFFGFFIGMSGVDAKVLKNHYELKDDECVIYEKDSKAFRTVVYIKFSLKGIRRVTKGGHTFGALQAAVEQEIGHMEFDYDWRKASTDYKRQTIDGVSALMSKETGLVISQDNIGLVHPKYETAASKAKREKDWLEYENATRPIVDKIIRNMVDIPGKEYQICKYEVTQEEWQIIMGYNPSKIKGKMLPVTNISYLDIKNHFLLRLNLLPVVKKAGVIFRLPTEDELEYACRAGAADRKQRMMDGREISFETDENGADVYGEVAWWYMNSEKKPHPVGQKKPNAFGLYDTLGNVSEWTGSVQFDENFNFFKSFYGNGHKRNFHSVFFESMRMNKSEEYIGFRLARDRAVTDEKKLK